MSELIVLFYCPVCDEEYHLPENEYMCPMCGCEEVYHV